MTFPNAKSPLISRALRAIALVFYCIALFLVFDLIYSNFLYATPSHSGDRPARTADAHFDHGLAANFDGYDTWSRRYRLVTNSLGFKDAAARTVPLTSDRHRILLIGDSFTEGIEFPFEETFAGLLYRAGEQREDKIEFLNAAVASYSPFVYHRKIKHLVEIGLHFDEVVVFSDISDVNDEATKYFCSDDDPQYRAYCRSTGPAPVDKSPATWRGFGRFWESNFVVSDGVQKTIRDKIDALRGRDIDKLFKVFPYVAGSGWTIPNLDMKIFFPPLGVEGGIARSLKNMQALADVLAARGIPLTIVVYPWPTQLASEDRNSRQVAIWKEFCSKNCKAFINLFPAFFAEKDAHADWYTRLFIRGDVHFSAEGHRAMFRAVAKYLLSTGLRSGRGVGDRRQSVKAPTTTYPDVRNSGDLGNAN